MYTEIKDKQPEMKNCFFAFNNEQFYEGKKKAGIENEKIFDGGYGLYGTKEGLNNLKEFYENQSKEIKEKCNPQKVYNYEFTNHECEYVGCDEEAIKIVVDYFGKKKANKIKRIYGFIEI